MQSLIPALPSQRCRDPQLQDTDVNYFRAGIWKPRTKPGMFEGVGALGLKWLQKVKKETGLK